jgi:transposase
MFVSTKRFGGEVFDNFVETLCIKVERPGLSPGIHFRSLMIGYFESAEAERRIAWRLKGSLSLRHFLVFSLDEDTPDRSTKPSSYASAN